MSLARELLGASISATQAAGICGYESSLVATGSLPGDAAALQTSMSIVTGADGTRGVILPVSSVGDALWIFNSAVSTLKVYPDTGAAISVAGAGLGVANAAFLQGANKATVYKRFTTTQWIALTTA